MTWASFGLGVAVGFFGAIGVTLAVMAGLFIYVALTNDGY